MTGHELTPIPQNQPAAAELPPSEFSVFKPEGLAAFSDTMQAQLDGLGEHARGHGDANAAAREAAMVGIAILGDTVMTQPGAARVAGMYDGPVYKITQSAGDIATSQTGLPNHAVSFLESDDSGKITKVLAAAHAQIGSQQHDGSYPGDVPHDRTFQERKSAAQAALEGIRQLAEAGVPISATASTGEALLTYLRKYYRRP